MTLNNLIPAITGIIYKALGKEVGKLIGAPPRSPPPPTTQDDAVHTTAMHFGRSQGELEGTAPRPGFAEIFVNCTPQLGSCRSLAS